MDQGKSAFLLLASDSIQPSEFIEVSEDQHHYIDKLVLVLKNILKVQSFADNGHSIYIGTPISDTTDIRQSLCILQLKASRPLFRIGMKTEPAGSCRYSILDKTKVCLWSKNVSGNPHHIHTRPSAAAADGESQTRRRVRRLKEVTVIQA